MSLSFKQNPLKNSDLSNGIYSRPCPATLDLIIKQFNDIKVKINFLNDSKKFEFIFDEIEIYPFCPFKLNASNFIPSKFPYMKNHVLSDVSSDLFLRKDFQKEILNSEKKSYFMTITNLMLDSVCNFSLNESNFELLNSMLYDLVCITPFTYEGNPVFLKKQEIGTYSLVLVNVQSGIINSDDFKLKNVDEFKENTF